TRALCATGVNSYLRVASCRCSRSLFVALYSQICCSQRLALLRLVRLMDQDTHFSLSVCIKRVTFACNNSGETNSAVSEYLPDWVAGILIGAINAAFRNSPLPAEFCLGLKIPPEWYDRPIAFKGNPTSLVGF